MGTRHEDLALFVELADLLHPRDQAFVQESTGRYARLQRLGDFGHRRFDLSLDHGSPELINYCHRVSSCPLNRAPGSRSLVAPVPADRLVKGQQVFCRYARLHIVDRAEDKAAPHSEDS